MEKNHSRLISIIIGLAVTITVTVQAYWNYQNYHTNKDHFIGDIQSILDGSVELYYTDIAKDNLFRLSYSNKSNPLTSILHSLSGSKKMDTLIMNYGTLNGGPITRFKHISSLKTDSISLITLDMQNRFGQPKKSFRDLASKIIVSLEADSLKLSQVDSIFSNELFRNRISLDYDLLSLNNFLDSSTFNVDPEKILIQAKSSYLPSHTSLVVHFSNHALEVFKRGIGGMLISFLTAAGLIGALMYLYQTIKRQKELAEIKDDLISNITHEFKTPIATVMSAIEGIERFNASGDPEKTKKYLALSTAQLQKLNGMVEKLLETSSLNQDQIKLVREQVDICKMVTRLVENYRSIDSNKTINLHLEEMVLKRVDSFHFENVISNLIDNAIKYGGDTININLKNKQEHMQLSVSNNGAMISKTHQALVFEKFFRIPSGNQHDVKGYGIGLYYTKKIVEKHGGKVNLTSNQRETNFEIII
jgi:signal transduction histidine kinase